VLQCPFFGRPLRLRRRTSAGRESLSGAAKDAAAFKQRLMGEGGKKCPDCAENVQADAKVCRFCGHHFEVVEAPAELA
jgi:predicted amidophosphoribosyltransferase